MFFPARGVFYSDSPFSPVPLQLDEVLREVLVQPPVGDVPQLDGAVFRRGGDDVVVERVPLDVEDLPAVPGHLKKIDNIGSFSNSVVHTGTRPRRQRLRRRRRRQ